jgi:molecular chaperone HscB
VNDSDYFALLGLVRTFDLDVDEIERAWKRVALAVHPDKFAMASATERRVAMQWSSRANEAYRVLRRPLSRARYLCELAGIDLQTETNTAMSSQFLMQQMQWHERLDESEDSQDDAAKKQLESELTEALSILTKQCAALLGASDYQGASIKIREWMFLEKMMSQVLTTRPNE